MISRSIAILIAAALPSTALTVPMNRPLAMNALVAGSLVTVLAALGLGSNLARRAAVAVTLWIGLSAFVFDAGFLDFAIIAPWVVATVVSLVGPFSAQPRTTTLPALVTERVVVQATERFDEERRAA